MEVIVKMLKKGRKSQGGGGGCVQRMEVIVKRKTSSPKGNDAHLSDYTKREKMETSIFQTLKGS